MKSLCAAITFLTILPLPSAWCGGQDDMARSLTWFPVVGLFIGIAVAAIDHFLLFLCGSPAVTSAITVVILVAASGGLHLDGLGDSADAFMSSRGRERMLEIMKDSCCGPMAVYAIVAVILLKFTALAALPQQLRSGVIILTPVAGRCAIVINNVVLTYARSDGGLATITNSSSRSWQAYAALLLLLLSSLLFTGTIVTALAITAGTAVFSLLFASRCRRILGGLTGDTLGAVCELAELLPPLLALICWQQGGFN